LFFAQGPFENQQLFCGPQKVLESKILIFKGKVIL